MPPFYPYNAQVTQIQFMCPKLQEAYARAGLCIINWFNVFIYCSMKTDQKESGGFLGESQFLTCWRKATHDKNLGGPVCAPNILAVQELLPIMHVRQSY